MLTPISESVLRALAGEAQRDGYVSGILVAAAEPKWTGEPELELEAGRVRVEPCISALAIRDVIAQYEPKPDELLVILTDRDERDVGQEVLARIWRNRLQRPSNWEALRQLFRVDQLDPALADMRWLVDLLVQVAPPRGYPPPPGGLLDLATAWRTVLRHALRLGVNDPTLQDFLVWGASDRARFAVDGPAKPFVDRIGVRLAETVDPVTALVLRLIAAGRGEDLVPFGLLCEVLWAADVLDEAAASFARVRFETPLGTKDLTTPMARSWAAAAGEVYRDAIDRREVAQVARWTERAGRLLLDLNAVDLALHSTVLPLGFEQRLIRAGRSLQNAVETRSADAAATLWQDVTKVEGHVRSRMDVDEDRVERIRMAARLAQWLTTERSGDGGDLAVASRAFVRDGAWVDRAREVVSHGETVGALAEAYDLLIEQIDQVRRKRDLAFARAFADWSRVQPTTSDRLLPIERVLDEIVAPLASQTPVLVLVLDGLSYPEVLRLEADIRALGWISITPERGLAIVVAAVPTVTVVSRASLLSGRLAEGGQDVEREGFQGHPGLRAAGGEAPRLFHKKDLKIEQGQIAPEVRDAVLATEPRVVGAVVNAVDDHLEKGAQLRLADGIKGIRPLRHLLDAAAEAGRVVVLVSDHGHVLEAGSAVRPASGSGERWRLTDPAPREDEVEIAGPRVLKGGGRIVAPGVESVRYIPMEKRGYHGGATPQEVLCPMLVLTATGTRLVGWDALSAYEPEWWRLERVPSAADMDAHSALPEEPRVDERGQVILFPEPVEPRAPASAAWVEAVLASPVLQSQRALAGRQALDESDLRAFLGILSQRGGVAPAAVLAEKLGLPSTRLRTKLEALRRMLNVDGYAVLAIESDGTARLNTELLLTQFEVES